MELNCLFYHTNNFKLIIKYFRIVYAIFLLYFISYSCKIINSFYGIQDSKKLDLMRTIVKTYQVVCVYNFGNYTFKFKIHFHRIATGI